MDSLPRLAIWLSLVAIALGSGCAPVKKKSVTVITETTVQYISASTLASRLGLRLERQTPHLAVLSGPGNSVTIFPGDNGRIFVNGKARGPAGPAITSDGKVFVLVARQAPIRAFLRHPPPKPKPVRPAPPPRPRPKPIRAVIVVDAGHGGKDPGTRGLSPVAEKHIVLDIAARLADLLSQRGARVIMTRSADTFIELDERAAVAERNRADLLLSIHADSARRRAASGVTFYIARTASTDSIRVANQLDAAFRAAGFQSRGIHRAGFRVLVAHSRPAVLFEAGFLTNPSDVRRLNDPAHRAAIARTLANTLIKHFTN